MIRYQSLDGSGRHNARYFRQKLYQSLPRFLAYCAIMRACRSVPQFRLQKPVVVGLVLPEGADMDLYEDAARYAAHGEAMLNGGSDGTEVLTRTGIRGVNHRKVSADQDVITFEIEDRPGLTPSFAQREFTRMVDRGDAEILRNYHAPTEASIRNTHEQLSLATCSPKKRRKAMFKAELCRRFLIKRKEADHRRRADGRKVNLGKPCLDWLLPEIANEIMMDRQKAARPGEEIVVTKLPSARQFARDMAKFMAGGMRVQKLISRQGTTSRQRRSANEAEYAIRFKFQKRCAADKRPSMAAAYLDYKGAIKQANDARAKGLPPLEHIGRKTFERASRSSTRSTLPTCVTARSRPVRSSGSPAQFSTVYKAFTGCTPDQDIFTAANFLDIDPNRALSQMIDEFERQENAIRRAA